MDHIVTRRRFLGACSATFVAILTAPQPAVAGAVSSHPTPRRGITGAHVLTRKQLAATPALIPLFDSVRAAPGIFDGIECQCGCTRSLDFYSLLTCFEGKAMARTCIVCQDQARLVARLHKEGKSLNQIRAAIDAEFR